MSWIVTQEHYPAGLNDELPRRFEALSRIVWPAIRFLRPARGSARSGRMNPESRTAAHANVPRHPSIFEARHSELASRCAAPNSRRHPARARNRFHHRERPPSGRPHSSRAQAIRSPGSPASPAQACRSPTGKQRDRSMHTASPAHLHTESLETSHSSPPEPIPSSRDTVHRPQRQASRRVRAQGVARASRSPSAEACSSQHSPARHTAPSRTRPEFHTNPSTFHRDIADEIGSW